MKGIERSQSNNVNVREITKQYISVVEKLTNQKKGLVYKKMEENGMLSGKDNMKAAQAISQCFEMRKINLIEDIFEKTKEKAGGVLTSDELNIYFIDPWDNRSLIKNYYQYQKSTYPSLNYVVKEFTDSKYGNKYQIWIRFELDFRPFIGLNLVKVYQDKNGEIKYMEIMTINPGLWMRHQFICVIQIKGIVIRGGWIGSMFRHSTRKLLITYQTSKM